MMDMTNTLELTEKLLRTTTGVELFLEDPESAFDYCNRWAIALKTQEGFEDTLDQYFKQETHPFYNPIVNASVYYH